MTNNYLRLTEAPKLVLSYPTCDACLVDVTHDGDGWLCPSCGTTWDSNDGGDAEGTLFEDWAGEPAGGPPTTLAEAWSARL